MLSKKYVFMFIFRCACKANFRFWLHYFFPEVVRSTLRSRAKMQKVTTQSCDWQFRAKTLVSWPVPLSPGAVLTNPRSQYWYTQRVLFSAPNLSFQERNSGAKIGSWPCMHTEKSKKTIFSKICNHFPNLGRHSQTSGSSEPGRVRSTLRKHFSIQYPFIQDFAENSTLHWNDSFAQFPVACKVKFFQNRKKSGILEVLNSFPFFSWFFSWEFQSGYWGRNSEF